MPFDSLRSAPWPAVARSNASTSVVVLMSSDSARKSSLSCKYRAKTDGYLFTRPFFNH